MQLLEFFPTGAHALAVCLVGDIAGAEQEIRAQFFGGSSDMLDVLEQTRHGVIVRVLSCLRHALPRNMLAVVEVRCNG
ncbi:hypothetical protein D9M68_926490 [compost metagenome]